MADFRKYSSGGGIYLSDTSPINGVRIFGDLQANPSALHFDTRIKSLWIKFQLVQTGNSAGDLVTNISEGPSAGTVGLFKHDSYGTNAPAVSAINAGVEADAPAYLHTKPWVTSQQAPGYCEIFSKGITLKQFDHLFIAGRRHWANGGNSGVLVVYSLKCVYDRE